MFSGTDGDFDDIADGGKHNRAVVEDRVETKQEIYNSYASKQQTLDDSTTTLDQDSQNYQQEYQYSNNQEEIDFSSEDSSLDDDEDEAARIEAERYAAHLHAFMDDFEPSD